MHVLITDCGGLIGPPLIRWLLANSDAVVVGTNERHERLTDLLEAPRFTFYVATSREYDALARERLDHTDVIVSLAAVEHAGVDEAQAAVEARAGLVRSCAGIGARLVYVTPAENAPGSPIDIIRVPPLSADHRDDGERIAGETERLIIAHGTIEQLDYVIVRTFGVITDDLEVLPAPLGGGVLPSLCQALLSRQAIEIPVVEGDRLPHAFVAADDAAEWIGRVILDQGERTTREVVDLASPGNSASAADIAQVALARFATRHWNGVDPLPRLAPFTPEGQLPRIKPNVGKAQRLVGWRPHRSLNEVIDAALDHLVEERDQNSASEATV